jgi:hypothetical protein
LASASQWWPHSTEVEWRAPVGCDFSGFFTEVVLGLVPALHRRGLAVRLLTGRCEPEWLRAKLTPSEAAVCVWSLSLSLFALN